MPSNQLVWNEENAIWYAEQYGDHISNDLTINNIDWIIDNILISLFLGGILTGLGLVIYWYSLKIISPLAVGTITYTEPLTGVLLSSLLLGESLALIQYIGFGIVLCVGIIQVLTVR